MKNLITLVLIILVLGSIVLTTFFSKYNLFSQVDTINTNVKDIKSAVDRLEKGQKEMMTKILEIQVKLTDVEKSLSDLKDQNKYTQYLVEKNGLDMRFIGKVITDLQYYEDLLKLKKKYMTDEKKDVPSL